MRPIFFRELRSFFSSIIGYVAIGVFLTACWLFLWVLPDNNFLDYGYASMEKFFEMAPWLLMLLIPAVTMRSFSDEVRAGTIEWLATKPLRDTDIILGKYFATLALIAFALLPTLVYLYSISNLAAENVGLDTGGIIGSYIGLFFLAAGFAAIGVFCSSLTSNQVVGFLIALFACYLFYTGFEALSKIPSFTGSVEYYLSMIGMQFHYNSISRGLIDSRDIIYFLSVIVLFIALTRISLARRAV
ncbi:MAG: gliding motility-associated ABC transporter permease subunit GldF [Bacteroidetes bacterium]|nr:gliding motility-associated ABC transporter permease subunit GldF [Bacteroidota bacterium]